MYRFLRYLNHLKWESKLMWHYQLIRKMAHSRWNNNLDFYHFKIQDQQRRTTTRSRNGLGWFRSKYHCQPYWCKLLWFYSLRILPKELYTYLRLNAQNACFWAALFSRQVSPAQKQTFSDAASQYAMYNQL